ncbi:MAG TPA: CPBP family intramembrane glutamic endopeptidase [Anaerolineales bacterium]|nr:CPBP family intramembrane glutamic endopeptidase [Anaerolineales bacterium]
MKNALTQRPLLSALLITLSWWMITEFSFKQISPWIDRLSFLPENGSYVIAQMLLCIYAIILLAAFGWWHEIGLTRIPSWRECLLFLPLLIAPLLILVSSGIHLTEPVQIGLALLFTLAIGFSEEIAFRGIVLRLFLPRGSIQGALIASAIFGLLHLGNIFAGQSIALTIVQIFFAALGGFGLAAPYIKTNALWPLIIVHMLVDFTQKLAKGFGHAGVVYSNIEMAIYLLGSIVIAGYAFWLLRRKDPVTPLAKATA